MNEHINVYSAIYNSKRETIKVFFESSDFGALNNSDSVWVIDQHSNKMLVNRADLFGIRFEIGGCEEITELTNRVRHNNNNNTI